VRATARGIDIARELAADDRPRGTDVDRGIVARAVREVRRLGLHLGLASNPVVGRVADTLVDLGGAVVLGEIAEIMGASICSRRGRRRRRPARSCCAWSTASKPRRWRSGSTSAARSRRPATSAAA
jgi:hypothetical protein